jgi:hypothetical protein
MIHELRIYHCCPGKLPDLIARFKTHTLGFFKQYGIKHDKFWTTLIGPSNAALYYTLEWESLAEREAKWNAFQADPKWIATRKETEANGQIVERIENLILSELKL